MDRLLAYLTSWVDRYTQKLGDAAAYVPLPQELLFPTFPQVGVGGGYGVGRGGGCLPRQELIPACLRSVVCGALEWIRFLPDILCPPARRC